MSNIVSMIHKHVTKRDLLRNPTQNFPNSPDEIVTITDRGIPMYSLSMNNVSFTSQVEPNQSFQVTASATGGVKIHDHKK